MSESTSAATEAAVDEASADPANEPAEAEQAQSYEPAALPQDEAGDNAALPMPTGDGELNLEMVLDVPVSMALEVGRTQISIRDLLKLNQGSVVELDQMSDQPMSVLVNGTLIAHGEVVVINEKFGIRLTDVISPEQRIKRLN